MLKRILLGLVLVVVALAAALAVGTWRTPSRQLSVAPAPKLDIDLQAAAKRLSTSITFRTVSSQDDPAQNSAEFDKLHAYLAQQFPKVHATLNKEMVGNKALLFTWTGTDPNAKPVALMAHQDVVPIAPGTESTWKSDPFGGEIKDGFIWGRGTLDNKSNLFSQLEAAEILIGQGFTPKQTVYFVMGDDEEVLGLRGAKPIVDLLKSRGVRLEWVLDEGLLVLDGMLPGLSKPAALIGMAEKGYGTFVLSLDIAPGHSSMPPAHTAIGSLSSALARLEATPMPATIGGVAGDMFGTLAPEMSGVNRLLLSNLWLLGPVVQQQLEKAPSTNAMLRTTTAITIVQAGNKDNVLPGHAEATVNFRILPGDTLASVEAHIRKAVGDDRIVVKAAPGNAEPTPVAALTSAAYRTVQLAAQQAFPDAVVAPGLYIAASDSRHFVGIADDVYRFSPFRARGEDLARFHGTNERLAISNYGEMIQFYRQLLSNSVQPQ